MLQDATLLTGTMIRVRSLIDAQTREGLSWSRTGRILRNTASEGCQEPNTTHPVNELLDVDTTVVEFALVAPIAHHWYSVASKTDYPMDTRSDL